MSSPEFEFEVRPPPRLLDFWAGVTSRGWIPGEIMVHGPWRLLGDLFERILEVTYHICLTFRLCGPAIIKFLSHGIFELRWKAPRGLSNPTFRFVASCGLWFYLVLQTSNDYDIVDVLHLNCVPQFTFTHATKISRFSLGE